MNFKMLLYNVSTNKKVDGEYKKATFMAEGNDIKVSLTFTGSTNAIDALLHSLNTISPSELAIIDIKVNENNQQTMGAYQ